MTQKEAQTSNLTTQQATFIKKVQMTSNNKTLSILKKKRNSKQERKNEKRTAQQLKEDPSRKTYKKLYM